MRRLPTDGALPPKRSSRVRSAVSNGSRLPGGASGCSAEGRRFSDIIHDLTAEMGGSLTSAEELQVRMIAGLILHAEQLQAAVLRGERIDSDQFTRISNTANRSISALRKSAAARAKATKAAGAASYLAGRGGDR